VKHQFGTMSQYEKCYDQVTHHHMICTQCGKVTEFQNAQLQTDIESAKLSRFKQTHYSLYVYGLCSKCQWKQNMELSRLRRSANKALGNSGEKGKKAVVNKRKQ